VHDAQRMRGARPFVLTNLKSGAGLEQVADFIVARGLLAASAGSPSVAR